MVRVCFVKLKFCNISVPQEYSTMLEQVWELSNMFILKMNKYIDK